MWKREEASKPVNPAPPAAVPGGGVGGARDTSRLGARDVVIIGKSVVIKGELSGSKDLTIEGRVEGKIELKQHMLTIGQHGRISAQVLGKVVVVLGEVVGNIKASEKVSIRETGSVEGDIAAPKVAIAEGARFRGKIDMQRGVKSKGEEKPVPDATPQARTRSQARAAEPAEPPAAATAGQ